MLEKQSLFKQATSSIKTKAQPSSSKSYVPLNTTLQAGLDKDYLTRESIYLLRTLISQELKNLNESSNGNDFQLYLSLEVALKRGKQDISTLLRTALMAKSCKFIT